ncbi:hypothetical protein R1sor_006093 [Riccia sorocarpa]|uniref:Uncharacterized protein n=1 Tax=Riccia sorocarpa TaxID=122646 RepID=A0ABD3HPY6_9MARC
MTEYYGIPRGGIRTDALSVSVKSAVAGPKQSEALPSTYLTIGGNFKPHLDEMKTAEEARAAAEQLIKTNKDYIVCSSYGDERYFGTDLHEAIKRLWPDEKRERPLTYSKLEKPQEASSGSDRGEVDCKTQPAVSTTISEFIVTAEDDQPVTCRLECTARVTVVSSSSPEFPQKPPSSPEFSRKRRRLPDWCYQQRSLVKKPDSESKDGSSTE